MMLTSYRFSHVWPSVIIAALGTLAGINMAMAQDNVRPRRPANVILVAELPEPAISGDVALVGLSNRGDEIFLRQSATGSELTAAVFKLLAVRSLNAGIEGEVWIRVDQIQYPANWADELARADRFLSRLHRSPRKRLPLALPAALGARFKQAHAPESGEHDPSPKDPEL